MIETPWSLEKLKKHTSKKEHDEVFAFPLDEKIIAGCIKNDFIFKTAEHDKIMQASLAAILLTGKTIFGDGWYNSTIGNLQDLESPRIKITDNS